MKKFLLVMVVAVVFSYSLAEAVVSIDEAPCPTDCIGVGELVLLMDFNEMTAKDYSVFSNDGVLSESGFDFAASEKDLSNADTTITDEIGNQELISCNLSLYTYLCLDGSGYVEVSYKKSLDVANSLTVEAWIAPENVNDTAIQRIVQRGSCTWGLFIKNGYVYFYTDTRRDGGTWMSVRSKIENSVWTHVAGIYSKDDNVMKLYINGNFAAEVEQTGSINTSNCSLFIGSANNTKLQTFKGQLDNIMVYSKALSDEEIKSHSILLIEYPLPVEETEDTYKAILY